MMAHHQGFNLSFATCYTKGLETQSTGKCFKGGWFAFAAIYISNACGPVQFEDFGCYVCCWLEYVQIGENSRKEEILNCSSHCATVLASRELSSRALWSTTNAVTLSTNPFLSNCLHKNARAMESAPPLTASPIFHLTQLLFLPNLKSA